MNSPNETSAKKYSWKFQKKWVRVEHWCVKKSPKKRVPTKKMDNSTGNRTPGLQWIFGFPSSFTYTLNRSSEVQTSGNPYLVKFTTEKKTWLKSTLPWPIGKDLAVYVRFPPSSSKIPTELRFHQNKNNWSYEEGKN